MGLFLHMSFVWQATGLSFLLGAFFATGIILSLHRQYGGLAIYLAALSCFHFLEFWLSRSQASSEKDVDAVDAFLLSHSPEYTLALTGALIEYFAESWLMPSVKRTLLLRMVGMMGVIAGQGVRSWAMWTAGDSFSHVIREVRKPGSRLITDRGPFRWLRHPSYAGFFLWALSLQMVLINPIMMIAYGWILFHFFRDRIRYEERLLVQFYGIRYEEYRRSVWSGIPAIK